MRKVLVNSGFLFVIISLVLSQLVNAACVEQYDREKPDHLYQDNDDGTVTDLETGLMWQKCPVGMAWVDGGVPGNDPTGDSCSAAASLISWVDALNAADASAFAAQTDWRLPNKKELASLMDVSCKAPAINTVFFPEVFTADFKRIWASTVTANSAKKAWATKYVTGDDILVSKQALLGVYLVRN
jgi:hypothetical protein